MQATDHIWDLYYKTFYIFGWKVSWSNTLAEPWKSVTHIPSPN